VKRAFETNGCCIFYTALSVEPQERFALGWVSRKVPEVTVAAAIGMWAAPVPVVTSGSRDFGGLFGVERYFFCARQR